MVHQLLFLIVAVEYLEITQVLYFILEVLRGASILRVFLSCGTSGLAS